MNSDVHPLVAGFVIALTIVAIATWVWGRNEAASIGGPAELRVDRNGHLYMQMQNKLVEHDANGNFVTTHDLATLGIEQLIGGFAFFSNGDILLRRGPDPRTFYHNIRAFQRKTNEQSINATTPDSGLYRCNLQADECTRFGKTGIDFKAANSIYIDWSDDDVYISDTSRHMLRKYSDDGELVAGPVSGFRFPNQLMLQDGQLYVADTNSHSIQILDPASDNFGTQIAKHRVEPGNAEGEDQRWPSHFARVGDEWWINNMSSAMDYGGLYIFDAQWAFDRKAELPEGADPISLVVYRGDVLVSDWYNDRVHRLSSNGEMKGEFESVGLAALVDESKERRSGFLLVSYSGIALLAMVIGGLFVRALVVTVTPDAANDSGTVEPQRRLDAPLHIEPMQATVGKAKKAMRLVGALLVVLCVSFTLLVLFRIPEGQFSFQLIAMVLGFIPFYLIIAWLARENLYSSVRIEGDQLTLSNRSGRKSTCSIADVRYDKTIIATHDMAVILGQAAAPLYDLDELKNELFPRLEKAQKLSAMQMQLLLLEMRHPQAVMTLLALLALAFYAMWSIVN